MLISNINKVTRVSAVCFNDHVSSAYAPLRGTHPQSEKGKVGPGKEYLRNWTSFVYRRDGVVEEDGLLYCNRGIILQVNPSGACCQRNIRHSPSGSTAA